MTAALNAEYLGRVFWMNHPDYENSLRTIVVQCTRAALIVRNDFGVRYKIPLTAIRSGLKEREKSPEAQARDAADLKELLAKGKRGFNDTRGKPEADL